MSEEKSEVEPVAHVTKRGRPRKAQLAEVDEVPEVAEVVAVQDAATIKAKRYADAPPMDAAAGDKTPAFVNWLFDNHPEDASIRYAGRKINR